jgi:hypothetical protein
VLWRLAQQLGICVLHCNNAMTKPAKSTEKSNAPGVLRIERICGTPDFRSEPANAGPRAAQAQREDKR